MAEMFTSKDMQKMLHVDLSTIYRMAEAGRLPAMKIGKQWRFPVDQVNSWMEEQIPSSAMTKRTGGKTAVFPTSHTLANILPLDCTQLIQDSYADILGIMIVITDMDGNPITEISNPCGLFQAISGRPNAVQKCIQSWQSLAVALDLTPSFVPSHLGLLCGRGLIRVGTELKGMVIAGCVVPDQWPPTPTEIGEMATLFDVDAALLTDSINDVHELTAVQRQQTLDFLPRIANIVAHIINERKELLGRLEAIADLTKLN